MLAFNLPRFLDRLNHDHGRHAFGIALNRRQRLVDQEFPQPCQNPIELRGAIEFAGCLSPTLMSPPNMALLGGAIHVCDPLASPRKTVWSSHFAQHMRPGPWYHRDLGCNRDAVDRDDRLTGPQPVGQPNGSSPALAAGCCREHAVATVWRARTARLRRSEPEKV